MKKSLFLRKGGIVPLLVFLLFSIFSMNAATITSTATGGPWNFTTTWVGGVAPLAGDDVVISAGATVDLTAAGACTTLTLNSTGASSTLNLNGFTLNVSGLITIARPATGADFNIINVNAATLNAVGGINFTNAGGTGFQFIYVTTGVLNVTGNVTGGSGSATTAINLTGNGTLKLAGSLFTALNGSLGAGTTSTVEYNGSIPQNVSEFTYANLTLMGTGVKTINNFSSLPLTTGVLSIATGTLANVVNSNVGVSKIKLGGFGKAAGIYGTTLSGAAIQRDDFFTVGTGTLNVASENRIATTTVTTVGGPYTYTGLVQGATVAVVTPSGAPAATLSFLGTGATVYGPSATRPTNAGTYSVTATTLANENYLASGDTDASNIAQRQLTVTGLSSASKVYDATTTATTTGTIVGIQNSEPTSVINVIYTSNFSDKNVNVTASTKTVNTVYTLSGSGASNYIVPVPATLTNGNITKATITLVNNTLTPIVVADQVYNGSTTVAGPITGGSLIGVLGMDIVLPLTHTGVYATKDVGTAKAMTSTSTLSGVDAGNYILTQVTNVTGNVTPKALNVTGTLTATKVYDSSVAATIAGGTINAAGGLVGADVVTIVTGSNGTYNTNAVGTGKTVTPAFAITGAQAGNYALVQPANLTNGIITTKLLGITASVTPKVYDGNTVAAVTGATLTGVLPIDSVALSGATTGVFANKNIGTAKVVTVTGATLTGVDAGNYALPSPFTLAGDITPKALTMPITPAPAVVTTKIYDGTVAASIVTSGPLVGIVGGENVVLLGTGSPVGFVGTGTFNTKDVGTAKPVTSTSQLTGADAANYTLTQPTGLTGIITQNALTITALPQAKCFGTTLNLGSTAFTLAPTSTQNGEVVSNVVLTSATGKDASLSAVVGNYPGEIVPSAATGSAGFLASNYLITYVNGDFTIGVGALVSAATPATSTLCQNTPLAPITHTTSNAIGIGTATGLPAGVTASWLANVITISGTPTVAGTFNYSIPLTSCGTVNATGTIVVNPTLTASVTNAASATTVCAGTSVTFTATPTNGGTPTYQWYNGVTAIAGATNATYTVTPVNGDAIKVVMTSTASPCLAASPATSNVVTMVVNPALTAAVAIAASPAGAVCAATSVTYTATPTNGGTTPAYQWFKGATAISGATSATYSYVPAVGNTDAINVRLTSNATPCLVGSPVISGSITTTVTPALATPTVTYSSGVLVSSSATGNQWYDCAGTLIAGATGQTYSAPVAGSYKVTVTSGGCSATSVCVSSWPLKVNGFDSKSFSYYPNPVNNELFLSYSKDITSVKVVNILGQVMSSKANKETSAKVDMSSFPAGLYLVEVKSGDESKTVKVMKN